ncbi:hypothetical protein AAFC00_003035 [Neodothiora populina]|uniref:Major facilitator superfamily (MFS) profile domain-containing protein n=1 Tax=Neodothiora populina TaxID=2781224 RepID=A0ABR3P9C1_9PEZI
MFTWLNGSDTTPPAFLEVRSSRWFIVFTVAAAVFTDIFLYGIVVPVLPFALTSRAGIAPDDVQTWVSILLAVYGAALLVASPICGWYADRSSSRKMSLLVGLVMLAGSTVLLTVGSSIGVYVAGRILQGFSAAVVWVVGLALLSDTVGTNELGEYMGYVAIAMSMGILAAPLLGGVVFDKGGYYDVFAMAYGLIGVDIVLRFALIEKRVAAKWQSQDDVTEKTESDDKESVARAAVQPEMQGNDTTFDLKDPTKQQSAAYPGTAGEQHLQNHVTALPSEQEKGWVARLPPVVTLLASRRLGAALFGCMVQASLLTSFDSILPLRVREIFHWDSIGAGLIFLPLTIPSFTSPIIGWAADKYGTRWLGTAGFILAIPPLILLRLVDHDSIRQKVLLCALLVLIGVTLDMILVPLMAEITYAVEAKAAKRPPGYFGKGGAYAQAYGLFNMSFAAGSMAGPLLAGLIKAHSGWGTTTLVLGCVSAFSVVPTVIWGGGSIFKERRAKKAARDESIMESGQV